MNPAVIDSYGWAMAEVYGACTDKILVNLAKYFPYLKAGDEIKGSFEYQARMLAQMGKVDRETVQIIIDHLNGADEALRNALTEAILQGLKDEEPKLRRAAERGLLSGGGVPELSPNQMQAFKSYYRQSADKLNLVNTVMLESTEAAYRSTVADVAAKIQRTQSILNIGTGEVVTGVSSYNSAVRSAVRSMVNNGLTGFVDHGGHRWSPEAYVAMDVKTTMMNTSRAAVFERNEEYGNDLYQVSSHNGARPLCYPWQGKILSNSGRTGTTTDLYGNEIQIHSESEVESFRYGGGLFGVNCGHFPMVFIPTFSTIKGEPQDAEDNARTYAESQEQRALERKLREERRDLEVMKAQGASPEEIKAQKERIRAASNEIDEFCDRTGRTRKKGREGTPVNATWPDGTGGKVTRYNGDYIGTDVVPPPKGAYTPPPPINPLNVAPQATQLPPVQHTIVGKTEKLARSMSTADYDEAAKLIDKSETVTLYEKYGDSCRSITQTKNGVYMPGADTVEYSFSKYSNQSKYSIMAHEMGHMFDAKVGRNANITFKEADLINNRCMIGSGAAKTIRDVPSSSDQFLEAMRKDKISLRAILNNSEELRNMKTGSMRNASAGVQDAMDGFFGTQDKNLLPWGHGDRYYNRFYNKKIKTFGLENKLKDAYNELGMTANNQMEVRKLSRDYETASELWANVISALTCGGEELDAFTKYMPETVEAARKIIGGI